MSKAICHIYGQLSQTGERTGEVLAYLHKRRIPADISFNLYSDRATLECVRDWQQRGNIVAPDIYPHVVDRTCTDSNWWAYSEAECGRLLKVFRRAMRKQGFSRFDAINTYTPGNGLIAACKKAGIEYLLGFCAPTVINDGHWQITHSAAPLSPYFAGPEDFRKPEAPGPKASLLIASMELRNPITCRENWSEGPFCPLNLIMGDRTIEAGELPVETIAMCEDFIRLSEYTGVPRFFHINLQYFTSPKCFDLNYRILDWLLEQRRLGRLEFTGLKAHAARLKRNGGMIPQATYWRGECMGQMVGGQPGNGHEAIIVENLKGQWQFRRGQAGAERFFDYQRVWKEPPFDPMGTRPRSDGYDAAVKVATQVDQSKERILGLRVQGGKNRTVAVWDALDGLSAPFQVATLADADAAEVIPHPGGTGGVILIHNPRALVGICILHGGRRKNEHSRRIRDLVSVETTWINGQPVTRLAPMVPYALTSTLRVKAKQVVQMDFVNGGDWGSREIQPRTPIPVQLDGNRSASMVRFWGVNTAQIQFNERELDALQRKLRREASRLAGRPVPYIGSVAEKDYPAWLVRAVRREATRDIGRTNVYVRKRFGRSVAACHMASDLPFGSKGRVRSTIYDRHERRGPEEFFPIFYDYGQSYGPGITGWNQFLRINLGVRGLKAGHRYRLVLHLVDPEKRNTRLRITAAATDRKAERQLSPDVMLKDPFLVSQGVDSRYDEGAFVSLLLPKACRVGKTVNIGIHSYSEYRLYDRLTEGFGFVFLSHAWLIRT